MSNSVASSSVEEGISSLSLSRPCKNIDIVSFAVSIPGTIDGLEINEGENDGSTVVGTITFMNKSAIIWIGWGDVEADKSEGPCIRDKDIVGTGTPLMGPLVVAMPRTKFAGVSRDNEDTPCSQLISGSSDEEMMIGWQMASRLSKRIGWPIFVSCALGGNVTHIESCTQSNYVEELSAQRAAAFAEREVGKILFQRKAFWESN